MPQADTFDAPDGAVFHGALLQAISEAFVGNGIQNDGDAEVTIDTNTAMGVDVAACTDLRYDGSSSSVSADSFTLSTGPTTSTNGDDDRRVDAIVFDQTLNSGSGGYATLEGTPHPNPSAPDPNADQLLLALVQIDHDASDIADSDRVLDWRAHAGVDHPVVNADVASDAGIDRSKLAIDLITSAISSDTTTDGDDAYLVDTSGGAVTVTLASADAVDGRRIQIIDVAGSAGSNAITVDTEGSESIDGESSETIDTAWGGLVVVSDGSDWFSAGGGTGGGDVDHENVFEGREGGAVPANDEGIVAVDQIDDGDTIDVFKATLVTAAIGPVPSGVDLLLVSFDNSGGYTERDTIVEGDAATTHDRVTGDPLATWENDTGSSTSVGVIVDNTTSSEHDIFAAAEGVTR